MLVGETEQTPGVGELWRHHNLRVSYVAQHSMHHLEEQQSMTPLEYIQTRFFSGRDREDMLKSTIALTPEEEAERAKRGAVESIVGALLLSAYPFTLTTHPTPTTHSPTHPERYPLTQPTPLPTPAGRRLTGKELYYEVKKSGRKDRDNSWEPLSYLRQAPPYVLKLVKDYDEKLKALQSGMEVRPLTAAEVKAHLQDFGIGEELALSRIRGFSGGQRSRLVLAAALWSRPHLLALDEPTNYLDREARGTEGCAPALCMVIVLCVVYVCCADTTPGTTPREQAVANLSSALKTFPGAVLVVSHRRGLAPLSPRFQPIPALCTCLAVRRALHELRWASAACRSSVICHPAGDRFDLAGGWVRLLLNECWRDCA